MEDNSSTAAENYKERFSLIKLLPAGVVFNSLIILLLPWVFRDLNFSLFIAGQSGFFWALIIVAAGMLSTSLALRFNKYYQQRCGNDTQSDDYWQNMLKATLIPYLLLETQVILATIAMLSFGALLVYLLLAVPAIYLMIRLWPDSARTAG